MSARHEEDRVEILSGVFEGRTTGTPIALLVRNTDAKSKDYADIARTFRPGHADWTYHHKYGVRDPRGGGRSSARETTMRVAAAVIAKKWLRERMGITVRGCMTQMGTLVAAPLRLVGGRGKPVLLARSGHDRRARGVSRRHPRRAGDASVAASSVFAEGVPAGLGEPLYGKLDGDLAAALMGINAVKGVEIGDGFASVAQRGTEHRDEITPQGFLSNHAGGILGGISTGQVIRAAIALKPTSSLPQPGRSIDVDGNAVEVVTKGRHDPCVAIRATPIAEAMMALVLMDHVLRHRAQCGDVGREPTVRTLMRRVQQAKGIAASCGTKLRTAARVDRKTTALR